MKISVAQVLVADDNTIIALDMRRLLEDLGAEAAILSSGEGAWAAVRQWRFDLIILKVHLPGLSGLEVCRRLKADAELRAIPVIFVGVETDRTIKNEALRLGAVDYLSNPFEPAHFKSRVLLHLPVPASKDGKPARRKPDEGP